MSTLDKINARLGKGKVRFAVEGYRKDCQSNSNYRRLRYTTFWNELLVVKT